MNKKDAYFRLLVFLFLLPFPDLSIEGFWGAIRKGFTSSKDEVMETLGPAWLGLQSGENSHENNWDVFSSEEVLRRLRSKLEQLCEWLQNHIYSRFQEFFEQDDEGVPRQWQNLTSEKIKEVYVTAMAKALGRWFSAL